MLAIFRKVAFNSFFSFIISVQAVGSSPYASNNRFRTNKFGQDNTKMFSPAIDQFLQTPFNMSTSPSKVQMPAKALLSKQQLSKKAKLLWTPTPFFGSSTRVNDPNASETPQSKRKLAKYNQSIAKTLPTSIINDSDVHISKKHPQALLQPRLFVMTTIGVINGFIAAGAGLSMGAVVLTGLLVVVKMAFAAVLLSMGWIYVM